MNEVAAAHSLRPPPADADTHDLAVSLGPALVDHCSGRLGPIEWFKASWQRGGSATGFSTWDIGNGQRIGVIVKFPVGPCELRWTTALGSTHFDRWHHSDSLACPTPRVIASGQSLAGYDLAWLITERLQGPALSSSLSAQTILDLLGAAADFHAAALRAAPVSGTPPLAPWEKAIDHSRRVARAGGIQDDQKWNDTLKKVHKHLHQLMARWEARPINSWCHGDLHPGNALRRPLHTTTNGPAHAHNSHNSHDNPHASGMNGQAASSPHTSHPCVLIDLALVHPGHWIEDALYLERQFWGHEPLLHGVKPLSAMAKLRRERGLEIDEHYDQLANIRRVLTAACAPANIEREGNPKYLHAALDVIERLLPQTLK